QAPLGVEHLDVAGVAIVVAQSRKAGVIAERGDGPLQRCLRRTRARSGDQRILDIGKRRLHRLAVIRERDTLSGFGLLHLPCDEAGVEDRRGQSRYERPRARRSGEKIAERGGHRTEYAGQRDRRKVKRLYSADLRVGRDQLLLRLPYVG